jgi:hypothetical protein
MLLFTQTPKIPIQGDNIMAKKAAIKKPEGVTSPSDHSKQLVEAIVTVRTLQDFIKERGGLDTALGTVTRVADLVTMTGSFEDLKAALEIVGREATPTAE